MSDIFCTRYKKAEWKGAFVSISWDFFQFAMSSGLLSYSDICVWIFIAGNERSSSRASRVSVRYIAKGMGCSDKTSQKAIRKLTELGLLESCGKGKYRTSHIEDMEAWKTEILKKFVKETKQTVVKNTTEDCSKNYHSSCSKKYYSGVVKNTTNTRNLNFFEIKEKSVCEEDRHTHPRSASEETNVIRLPLLDKQDEDDPYYQELTELLQIETNLACMIKNPVVTRKFFCSDWEFPTSYIPPTADNRFPFLLSRYIFLRACNILCDIQREKSLPVYVLPVTEKDVSKFGDVLSAFLGFSDWEDRFSEFMSWVYDNKSNYAFNFLHGHLQDWASKGTLKRNTAGS